MLLPLTDINLYLHVRRAHLLWKAVDQQGPPDVSISENGWKIDDGITCPSIDNGPPPLLMNVIRRRCRAKNKACKEGNCSCDKFSCTIYCLCPANHLRRKRIWGERRPTFHQYDDYYVDRDELLEQYSAFYG